ncbi:MAG: FAD-dependent monooxygenase [Chitinophagaceae bacterium]|nr:FAD-dependent monooxygenase [Chitinophagaceae bacterium]
MQQQVTLRLLPSQAASSSSINEQIAMQIAIPATSVNGFYILKQSIDARGKQPWINMTVTAFINEPVQKRTSIHVDFKDVHNTGKRVIIAGAGPAGLFAALQLIELGIKPVIVERGKDVRARRRDLATLNKEGEVNPESNYCFGEGGAGTYSDGKLYTRSSKRGNIDRILQLFVHFGADEKILYQSHPHIGTNKLPQIITAMREQILSCGGVIHFETKLTNFIIRDGELKGIEVNHKDELYADAVILATGHSARDLFELLHQNNILIEAKPFALGVRIEHPQALIDSIQYRCYTTPKPGEVGRGPFLPPASYSLVEQVQGKGVFSFCMCPGGIIAPASTAPGELVVNGWSPSKRNNAFANSGMVVTVDVKDASDYFKAEFRKQSQSHQKIHTDEQDPLLLMKFQQAIEQKAFIAGGGNLVAPAQRMADMFNNKVSSSLPSCSYLPGTNSTSLADVLPGFIFKDLQLAFKAFGEKMRGYFTNEAIVVATESRTSSPVRIPRNPDTLQHPQLKNLYPCGEGAGYAGGIVSAAMDGERVAVIIHRQLNHL